MEFSIDKNEPCVRWLQYRCCFLCADGVKIPFAVDDFAAAVDRTLMSVFYCIFFGDLVILTGASRHNDDDHKKTPYLGVRHYIWTVDDTYYV